MKQKKKRNPVAYELLCSGKYRKRVLKNKKIYSRREKHPKSFGKQYPELLFCFFPRFSYNRIRF